MSRPSKARCYNKLVEDPSLLRLFLAEECMPLLELPVMCALWFRLILERFFTWVVPPTISEEDQSGVFHWDRSESQWWGCPMVILISDVVAKGDLGMVITFCSHNQTKMEASEVLTTFHQHALPKPRVFMVGRYTNTPFIPLRSLQAPLPQCEWSSLGVLLLPSFLWTACIYGSCIHILRPRCSYPVKRGRQVHTIPLSQEGLWKCS